MPNPDPFDLPPPTEPSHPGAGSDLHGLIRLVLDKSWLIISFVVLALIIAAVYVERAPRTYQAVATVEVQQEEQKIVDVRQVVSENMQGLEVLNTVANKLGNGALLELALDENHLLPPAGTVVTNQSRTLTRQDIVTLFSKSIKTSLRRNTRLIDITVRSTSPQLAAALANSLVKNYLEQETLSQQATTEGANVFLKQESERLKKKLEASEQALQAYRKEVGSVSLQTSQDVITPQLQDLNKRLTASKADLIQVAGAYQDSLKMSTNSEDLLAYPQVASEPEVAQISAELVRLENDFAVIRQRYREKHPKYILAKSSLAGLKKQLDTSVLKVRARIQETLRIANQNALTAKLGLETQLHDAETNAMQLSDSAVRFNVLTREVESDQALFSSVIKRLGETTLTAKIAPERISVVQPALVPELPVSPKIKTVFALALFGGLALGLGVSFVLFSINTSFRTVDEVEHYLALPVLGTAPKLKKSKDKAHELVAAEGSNSPGAEVFRSLRATLSMLGHDQDRRTYLFTSSLPSEGKTFTSVNYAVSLAQQGLRTLLVDFDLRRPMVEEFFLGKTTHIPGVTDYLLGRKKFDELCQPHPEIAKLAWMPAGSMVPNPAELLTQADFQQFLNVGLAHYDRIVIDTAPVLPVSDTLLLAGKVQTVVLVVHAHKTSRKAVQRAVQLLKNASAPIGGVLLNLLPNRHFSGYYYSYYHGYGYGHYGQKESKVPKKELTETAP